MKIKNLKINKDKIKVCTSCILIATTTAVGMKITNVGFPFYIDSHKEELYNVKLISSNGESKSYTTTESQKNLLYHYGTWQPSSDGLSQRNYKVYKLNTNSKEQLLNDVQNIEKLEKSLGDYIIEGTEYKEILSQEETDENEYWQAFIYNKLENNYIIVKETNLHNLISSIIYTLTTIGLSSIPYIDYTGKKLEKKKDNNKK